MRQEVKDLLAADGTLMAILTGGVHAGAEISKTATPDAFDEVNRVKPCALVKLGAAVAVGPSGIGVEGEGFEIYNYEQDGFGDIDAAIVREKVLLDGGTVDLSAGFCYEIRWTGDVRDLVDPVLGCSMSISRYRAVILR
ncbi:MAG: hypothetical protein ACYC1U_06860 [Candidatus Aquicultorales bacterium]